VESCYEKDIKTKIEIVGVRMETDEEFKTRIKEMEDLVEKQKLEKEMKKTAALEKKKKLLEKLKSELESP